jgi:hypothetical protein
MSEFYEIRKKILHRDCYGTTAILIAIDDLGIECLQWIPETIVKRLDKIYGDLPVTTYNKLFAAQTVITTDFYYRLLDHFHTINNCLFHGTMDDAITDSVEFAWGLVETQILMPHPIPADPKDLFSNDILQYLDILWKHEGLLKSPHCYSIGGFVFNNMDTVLNAFIGDKAFYEGLWNAAAHKALMIDMFVREKIRDLMYELRQAGFNITPEFIVRTLSYTPEPTPVEIPVWLL